MKHHLIKLLPLLLSGNSLNAAWVTTYSMTPSQPAFVSINGVAGASSINDFGFCPDQTVSPVINIGFAFVFDGTSYTNFVVTDNGILIFGNWSALSNCGSNAGTSTDIPNDLSDVNIPRPFLAPLWEELQFKPTSPTFGSGWYKSSGGVCTVEWNKMCWRAPTNTDQITFQVVLYQTTNVIDFNYFQGATALGSFPSASIGLGAIAPGTFYSLNNSTNTATASSVINTSTIATKPTTNQRFRWAPVSGLPIELISFKGFAKGKENVLEWSTATQVNNDYFTIERSVDCSAYSLVAKIDGAGNCHTTLTYSATDPAPYDITYYRLNWTDYNNVTEHSPIIMIAQLQEEEEPPNIFPNPVQNLLHFSAVPDNGIYSLMNIAGQCVASGEISKENPVLDISTVPGGVYLLVLNAKMHYKVVVSH